MERTPAWSYLGFGQPVLAAQLTKTGDMFHYDDGSQDKQNPRMASSAYSCADPVYIPLDVGMNGGQEPEVYEHLMEKLGVFLLIMERQLKYTGGDIALGTRAVHQIKETLPVIDNLHRLLKREFAPVARVVERHHQLIRVDIWEHF